MNIRRLVRLSLIPLCILTVWLILGLIRQPQGTDGPALRLTAPDFVTTAHAQDSIAQRLDEEAGMSAYFKSTTNITLSRVRSQFRTIETETADYILGSVALASHPEYFDAHVYVHRTGWILAYYPRTDPVSKIVDVRARTINTTKLERIVGSVAGAAGVPSSNVTHYDFRFPDATHMMFIAEDEENGNDFSIQLPSSYGYYERSWAVVEYYGHNFILDGIRNPNQVWGPASGMVYGIINGSQLLPDVPHTISVSYWGVLVVVYKVQ